LKIDLNYPKEFYNLYKDYLLAPEISCILIKIYFHKSKRIYININMEKMPVIKKNNNFKYNK
jgi:hypothetical protein